MRVVDDRRQQKQGLVQPVGLKHRKRGVPPDGHHLRRVTYGGGPELFVSPNLIELAQIYRTAAAEPLELTSHEHWWRVVDSMSLGSQFRLELKQLARLNVCDSTSSKGTLGFLLDNGIAQMAVNLLPFFQHLVLKAGDKGLFTVFRIPGAAAERSAWVYEQSNVRQRQVVAHGRDGGVVVLKHYPAIVLAPTDVVNVTGAGDSLVGAVLATIVQDPKAFHSPTTLAALAHRAQQVR